MEISQCAGVIEPAAFGHEAVEQRQHAVGAVDPMDLADPALMQILSRFQRHLDVEALRLQGQLQHGEVDEEAFVLPMLQEFAERLQSRTRSAGRRTRIRIDPCDLRAP